MEDEFSYKQRLATRLLQEYLEAKDYERLSGLTESIEKYISDKDLKTKAYNSLGEYYTGTGNLSDAILVLNKSRQLNPESSAIFESFINAFISFYESFKTDFIRQDLKKLYDVLVPVLNFHLVNYPLHKQIALMGRDLLLKMDYRLSFTAKDEMESIVSYRVTIIHDRLRDDMTMDEVADEFARILAPVVREKLDKKEKAKKGAPKKDTGSDKDDKK